MKNDERSEHYDVREQMQRPILFQPKAGGVRE